MTSAPAANSYLHLSSGEKIFYREAGSSTSPTLLLLHGFPSSSNQFRNLIPRLSPHYHIIAPDLPGFGFTEVPETYTYTFDSLATTISSFLIQLPERPKKYSIYIFDYGAPTGLRLALQHPERIEAIITQNGNAYNEGLGAFWDPLKTLWAEDTKEHRDALRPFLELGGTKMQYDMGHKDPSVVDPASYTLDQALLDRPGNKDIQIDLFYDYRTNVELYPKFHEYFNKTQVPLLAIWGKEDVIFVPAGAEAFKKDLPKAEIQFLDAGHFAIEGHEVEMAEAILKFLKENGIA